MRDHCWTVEAFQSKASDEMQNDVEADMKNLLPVMKEFSEVSEKFLNTISTENIK
ncbi:MAG: hypothetical protein IPG99_02935 [Ignavibacteria bacterium]|nr:hypothetical protein [Ignavibacteria bacterium]